MRKAALPFRELENIEGLCVLRDRPVKDLTTFRIGGPARLLLVPRGLAALEQCLGVLHGCGVPFHILGRGSNLLVSDNGVGAVLSLASLSDMSVRPVDPDGSSAGSVIVEAGAGCGLRRLVAWSASRGLTGLEGLAGIPASIGGAFFMNAGAGSASFGRLVNEVLLTSPGGSSWVAAEEFAFSYRHATVPEGAVVTAVRLRLKVSSPALQRRRIAEVMKRRVSTQPLGNASAGCIFRNFPDIPAGKLIDRCGLKGARLGNAEVSSVHANFIINRGGATFSDVAGLVEKVREEVFRNTGRELETEVRYWQ